MLFKIVILNHYHRRPQAGARECTCTSWILT